MPAPKRLRSYAGTPIPTGVDVSEFADSTDITGVLASSFPRWTNGYNSVGPTSDGRLDLFLTHLRSGLPVTSLTFATGSTGVGTPANWWFALYTYHATAPTLLGQTADQTTTAWGANTTKTLALQTPYQVTAGGLYYIGIMVNATSQNNLQGFAPTNTSLFVTAPFMTAYADTGLTTTAPATAAISGAGTYYPYFDIR